MNTSTGLCCRDLREPSGEEAALRLGRSKLERAAVGLCCVAVSLKASEEIGACRR
jgi:hypothetical protein